jgi:hypothetical protein
MKKTSGQVERRKHIRFKVKGAYVILRPYDKKLGTIVDISAHGLTCDYFCEEDPSTKSTTLDIFTNGDFRLFGVPCRTISDFETLKTPLRYLSWSISSRSTRQVRWRLKSQV